MFKVAIVGGSGVKDFTFFTQKCAFFLKNKAESGEGIMIYTTGDDYVDKFAKKYHINTKTISTNWNLYGKNALKERNKALIKECDALIYFNDGLKDTKTIYEYAKSQNLPCRIAK